MKPVLSCRNVVVALGVIFIVVAVFGDQLHPTGNPGFGPTQLLILIAGAAVLFFRARICGIFARPSEEPEDHE